jgi:ketosteroid isomerase-like protein
VRFLLVVLLLASCASGASVDSPEATVQEFLAALDKGDRDIALLFTEDATMFFPMNAQPLRLNGRAEIAAAFAALFGPNYRGGMPPPQDLQVQHSGNSAIVTFQTVNPNVTSRRTLVLRRDGGRWRIAHLHGSNIRKETQP